MGTNLGNRDAWNRHASRYQRGAAFSFDNVDYGIMNGPTEKEWNLIGDVSGKRVLELGCGGANCGIALAKRGALVTCIDISSEQIAHARGNALRERVEIDFLVADMEKLHLPDSEYDVVLSMAALGYAQDIAAVFEQIWRLLKDRGIFVGSLPDAVGACVTSKYLWNDPPETHSYFYTGPTHWKWEEEDDFTFATYRRPLGEYINMLADLGFMIRKVYQVRERFDEITNQEQLFASLYPSMAVVKAIKIEDAR